MPDKTPSSRKAALPDLYRQLGLKPLENDRGRIEAAVKKLLAGAAVAEPGKARRIAAVVELSQRHLLEPERKQIYDRQWAQVFSGSMPSEQLKKLGSSVDIGARGDQAAPMRSVGSPGGSRQTSGKPLESLQSYLPAADPLAAFRATSTPVGSPQPQLVAATDFAELQEYLTRPWEGMKSAAFGFSAPSSANSVSGSAAPLAGSVGGLQAAPIGARRKQLENSFLSGILAFLACLAIVLSGIYWFTRPDTQQTPPTALNGHNASQRQAVNPDGAEQSADASQSVRRSGLPPVPGLQSTYGEPETPSPIEQPLPDEFATAPETTQVGTATATPAPIASDDVPSASRPTGQSTQGLTPASMPESEPLEMDQQPLATPPASAALSGAELIALQEKLDSVWNLLGQQQYSEAIQRLDELDAVSRNTPQRVQWERLRLLTELAAELRDYLVRAVDGLDAGETVTIGSSTQASFVEGSPNRIVVRIRGQNQGFSWTELPIGLVYALVDLVMDVEHPRSKACKAAFTLVHPASQNNELALQRARGFMSEAISAGSIPSDMLELFE